MLRANLGTRLINRIFLETVEYRARSTYTGGRAPHAAFPVDDAT